MKKLFILTVIAAALLTAGCTHRKTNIEMLTAHEWLLDEVRFANSDFTETPPPGTTVMLADTANRVSGNGSCNRFFGTYTADENGKIDISVLGATMMACSTLEFETRYFGWLEETDSYEVDENSLKLKTSATGTTLVYKPVLKAVE